MYLSFRPYLVLLLFLRIRFLQFFLCDRDYHIPQTFSSFLFFNGSDFNSQT